MTEASTINVTARLTCPTSPGPAVSAPALLVHHPRPSAAPPPGPSPRWSCRTSPPTGNPVRRLKEAAVRQEAESLYGRAYAFIYRPDQADRSVHAYRLPREHVPVSAVEVWA
jgi:hypothetical protein